LKLVCNVKSYKETSSLRTMDQITSKTPNPKSSLLVFNRVYRLEIQSVMLVFFTPLVK
jgi:hypothetical protein